MPTRYRPALAGEDETLRHRQSEEGRWKGIAMMASVCTAIGRLTFTPMDVSVAVGPDTALNRLFALCTLKQSQTPNWTLQAGLAGRH